MTEPVTTAAATRILRRRHDLDLRIDASGSVAVALSDGGELDLGPHGLTVLHEFTEGRPVGEVLARSATTTQEWIHLSSAIERMVRAGILIDPSGSGAERPEATNYAFDWHAQHIAMLGDRTRTELYQRAIRSTVRPGDVVLDIGTGTGVLAATAARAGAARVYAVEAGSIADAAERLFAANGVAERVQLLRGWSTRLEPPERVDLVVSEIIGKDPLDERVLEVLSDARARWMHEDGRMLPHRLVVLGTVVEVPEDVYARMVFTEPVTRAWEERYGLDFSALSELSPRLPTTYHRTRQVRGWRRLSRPTVLADLDLRQVTDTRVEREVRTAATQAGAAHGVLLHFRLHLADGVVLSTDPATAGDDNSWRHALTIGDPHPVVGGQPLTIRYRYRCAGTPDGATVEPG